jgi:cytochrome c-type biogenesis protein CcmH/NrfG
MAKRKRQEEDPVEGDPQTHARRLTGEGARLLSLQRPGEAAARLERAWQLAPGDPDIAINLGGAYVMQHRWTKAVRFLEAATKLHPDNAMLWVNLAAAYLGPLEISGAESQNRAIAAFEQALRCDPLTPNVHYSLGLIYAERGEYHRAAAHFWRALEVNPEDRDAQRWLQKLQSTPDDSAGGSA